MAKHLRLISGLWWKLDRHVCESPSKTTRESFRMFGGSLLFRKCNHSHCSSVIIVFKFYQNHCLMLWKSNAERKKLAKNATSLNDFIDAAKAANLCISNKKQRSNPHSVCFPCVIKTKDMLLIKSLLYMEQIHHILYENAHKCNKQTQF